MAGKKGKTPEYDSHREQNVLLEQMNKSINLIAEQHGEMNKNIGEIKSELETVKMAVMENSMDIKVLKRDVGQIKVQLDKNIDNHEKRITKIEEKIGI
jgi:septal ring factor EnvC (AmiA/AmiB activator)